MDARGKFIEALKSRGMMRPCEEWVIDANLKAFAYELAEKQREQKTELTDSVAGWFAIDRAADLIDPEEQ